MGSRRVFVGGDLQLVGQDMGYQLVGQDYEDYLTQGGSVGQDSGMSITPAELQMIQQARQAGGIVARTKMPTEMGKEPLPITATNVGPLLTALITLQPQRVIRIDECRIDSVITPFFDINFITVGVDNVFCGPGAVPADIYSSLARGSNMKTFTANPGTFVTLSVTSRDAVNIRRFSGAFFGPTVS